MVDIGLVLGGGGAKGAYEMGACKALSKTGLHNSIRAYSGTSIGAINCALLQLMNYEKSAEVWLGRNIEKIFVSGGINYKEILDIIMNFRKGKKNDFDGIFSRDGLINFFDKIHIYDLENMKNDLYVTVVDISDISEDMRIIKPALDWYDGKKTGITKYINLKNTECDYIVKVLLATSAMPVIYPPVEIDGCFYVDGGINDNLPISPIYQRGYRRIIAVSTDRINKYSLARKFPSAEILLVHPSGYLGNLFNGTLNFNRNKIRQIFKLGYNDAMNAIKRSNFLNY